MRFYRLRRLAVALALLGLTMSFLGCCLGPKMIYPAPHVAVPQAPPVPLFTIETQSGIDIWGAEVSPTAPTVVWCHGNGENLATLSASGLLHELRSLGVNVMAMDYPGYGRSPGRPDESGVVASVVETLRRARDRWPDSPLVLAGSSLGAGAASQAALEHTPDGLILFSPFLSLEDAGRFHFPAWMVWLLKSSDNVYDSRAAAPRIACPVLIFHGRRDGVIPFAQGERLATRFPRARFVAVDNRGHNDLLDSRDLWQELSRFIASIDPGP